ncbi:MAG: hypothetical protein IPI19_08490 [Ignavibacteriales bacterium]|nr:hypothetical protein [Ignavibacteriales bacterium]
MKKYLLIIILTLLYLDVIHQLLMILILQLILLFYEPGHVKLTVENCYDTQIATLIDSI